MALINETCFEQGIQLDELWSTNLNYVSVVLALIQEKFNPILPSVS